MENITESKLRKIKNEIVDWATIFGAIFAFLCLIGILVLIFDKDVTKPIYDINKVFKEAHSDYFKNLEVYADELKVAHANISTGGKYIGQKEVKYITVKVQLYNRVKEATERAVVLEKKIVGPFKNKDTYYANFDAKFIGDTESMSNEEATYIKIVSITLEYFDGTTKVLD